MRGLHRKQLIRLMGAVALASLCHGAAIGRNGEREDRGQRVSDAADKAAERAARDSARSAEDAQRVQERAARDSVKASEERAKQDADRQERQAKDAADAAAEAERQAEEAAKDAQDAAEEAAKAAEDAAKEAAKAAEDAAKDAREDYSGSSESMRDLATEESPEFDRRGYPVRKGEVVALDPDGTTLDKAEAAGFRVIEVATLENLGSMVVRLAAPEGMGAAAALEKLRTIAPSDSFDLTHYYGLQYAPQGAAKGKRSKSVTAARKGSLAIGMIDTRVSAHSALGKVTLSSKDFSTGTSPAPVDHGTAIASLLADEGAGHIYVANIFRGGTGQPFTSADSLVRALDWLVGEKVTVINISLAGPRNAILDKLISGISRRGYVVVAAAGNGGPRAAPAYPAALADVVAVTAVDRNSRVYRYANQGRYITVASVGVDISAAKAGGGSASYSGTSFATPHVAAWMARCAGSASVSVRNNCIKRLQESALDLGEPGKDPIYGYGLIR